MSTELIEKLFTETSKEKRCPHLCRDDVGPYCSKGFKSGSTISEKRRMICDAYSLQLWCLSKEDYDKCIFYKGEPIEFTR